MTPFYTGEGDSGETGYLGKGRLSKTSLRIEAVGSVDEANASLGFSRSIAIGDKTSETILQVQKQLYILMSELSTSPEVQYRFDRITEKEINFLEGKIVEFDSLVAVPREFIIPGENPSSAALSLSRAIIRRAERKAIALLEADEIKKPLLIAYLNRLSSLVFVLELYETSLSGSDIRLTKED